METIQLIKDIILKELQDRVKYILSFKNKLEILEENDIQQGVTVARALQSFINAEDKEVTKTRYDRLMKSNNYLSNYKGFILEFRQFNGQITKRNLHSFIFEITSAHESTVLNALFPNGNVQFKDL